MSDVALQWTGEFADMFVDGADVAANADGLQTAILVSLFTDARVPADDLPEGETERRGWWGDQLGDGADEYGSKLWLLRRRKRERDIPAQAAAYAREALQWMVEDDVAVKVTADAEWAGLDELRLRVVVSLPEGSDREFQFENVLRGA